MLRLEERLLVNVWEFVNTAAADEPGQREVILLRTAWNLAILVNELTFDLVHRRLILGLNTNTVSGLGIVMVDHSRGVTVVQLPNGPLDI